MKATARVKIRELFRFQWFTALTTENIIYPGYSLTENNAYEHIIYYIEFIDYFEILNLVSGREFLLMIVQNTVLLPIYWSYCLGELNIINSPKLREWHFLSLFPLVLLVSSTPVTESRKGNRSKNPFCQLKMSIKFT